jgi:hypothetical protein
VHILVFPGGILIRKVVIFSSSKAVIFSTVASDVIASGVTVIIIATFPWTTATTTTAISIASLVRSQTFFQVFLVVRTAIVCHVFLVFGAAVSPHPTRSRGSEAGEVVLVVILIQRFTCHGEHIFILMLAELALSRCIVAIAPIDITSQNIVRKLKHK